MCSETHNSAHVRLADGGVGNTQGRTPTEGTLCSLRVWPQHREATEGRKAAMSAPSARDERQAVSWMLRYASPTLPMPPKTQE